METVKDKNTAQILLEEIETAKLFHPTSRQDTAFLARIATLSKRLSMRGDPAYINGTFPRPYHPLFDSQDILNETIVETLSSELAAAVDHSRRAEFSAKEYHATYEVVKKVESACQNAQGTVEALESILRRLEHGTEAGIGDGGPPNLTSEACLQLTSHSVYLSLFPSLVDELQRVDEDAGNILESAQVALLDLGRPGIDPQFASSSVAIVDRLEALRITCSRAQQTMADRVSTLRGIRNLWTGMAQVLEELDEVRSDMLDAIRLHRWHSQADEDAALLTPESPASVLPPPDLSLSDATARLDDIRTRMQLHVSTPLNEISSSSTLR